MLPLETLITSYINEKATSNLLAYNAVADIFIEKMKDTSEDVQEPEFVRNVREMERERIKYFLKEYIITRLEKINSNLFHSEENMSSREASYYRKYLELVRESDVVGEKIDSASEYVGFYCIKDVHGVKIDSEILEVYEGDFFVARFEDVAHLIREECIVFV